MTALCPDLCVIHDGEPVQLISKLRTEDDGSQLWWCKILFAAPEFVARTFHRDVAYRKLHANPGESAAAVAITSVDAAKRTSRKRD